MLPLRLVGRSAPPGAGCTNRGEADVSSVAQPLRAEGLTGWGQQASRTRGSSNASRQTCTCDQIPSRVSHHTTRQPAHHHWQVAASRRRGSPATGVGPSRVLVESERTARRRPTAAGTIAARTAAARTTLVARPERRARRRAGPRRGTRRRAARAAPTSRLRSIRRLRRSRAQRPRASSPRRPARRDAPRRTAPMHPPPCAVAGRDSVSLVETGRATGERASRAGLEHPARSG